LGFDLAVGSIERSTRLGPPRFDDTDTFVLNIGGASWDLVPIDAASTRFRTVLASGWLVERVRPGPWGLASAQFVARDRDGRRFRFGSAAASAATGSTSTSQVADFKWGLDRVEDTSGNVMEIAWAVAGRELYPVRVEYASHPATGLPATNVVELCWEERGDRTPSASGEVLTHRLHEVRTYAGTLPARRFTFTYASIGSLTAPLGTCRFDVAPPGPVNSLPGPTTNPGPAQPPSAPRIAPAESESPVASSSPSLTKLGKTSPTPGAAPAPVSVTTVSDEPGVVATDDVAAPPTSLPPVPSLLVRIDRADGSGALLPPIDYVYNTTGQPAWPSAGSAGLVPPAPFLYVKSDADEDSGARLVDLNRDGLPDLALFEGRLSGFVPSTTAAVWLNTGQSFQYSAAWSAALLQLAQPGDVSRIPWFVIKRDTRDRVENGVRFVDVNDDGRIDILRSVIWFGAGVRKELFLNTGSGFTGDVAASYLLPDEPFVDLQSEATRDLADDRGVRLADLDADGRTDLLVARAEWGAVSERRVYRNVRTGFALDARFILPDEPFVRHIPHGHCLDTGLRLMELNGDGFPDLFRAAAVDGMVSTATYLHTGPPDGVHPTWAKTTSWGFLGAQAEHFVQITSAGEGGVLDRGLRVADVDGDGKSDIVIGRRWNGGPVERFLFSPAPTGEWRWRVLSELPWIFVDRALNGPSRDTGVRLSDLDGDGGVDLLLVPNLGTPAWRPNTAWRGRALVASCSNGLGGRIELSYAPAPHTGAIEGGTSAELPFPFPVVSEVRLSDGLGQTLSTRFEYSGGFYHHARRELRGFRQVIATHPGGALRTESIFVQQPNLVQAPLRGVMAERLERRVSDGAILSRTIRTFDPSDLLPPLRHPIVREETRFFDWSTSDAESTAWTRRVAVSWTYQFDETAGPERPLVRSDERREGDTADPADDRIVRTEYASALGAAVAGAASASPWRLEQPWHETTLDASGNVAAESWTAYDGAPLGTAGARGLPTRFERRGGTSVAPGAHGPGDSENPVTLRTYDAYGNLASETDPLGFTRRFEHGVADATFTFPESETDPLGRSATRRFDPRTGLMTESLDANGRSIVIEYDGFGRRLAEWGPGDTRERPTVSYRHEIGAVPSRVHRFARETSGQGERAGTAGCLESVAYYDGLGRLLEVAAEHPAGRLVTGAVTWDAAGRVARRAEPFLAAAGAAFVPPAPAAAAVLFEYDAAGRLLRATDAAGQVTTDEPGSVVAARIDPLGHRIETTLDAEGRAVMVREFEGVGGAAAPRPPARYRYDVAGRLLEITDPMGAMTRVQYDLLGRRTSLDDPHIGSWRSTYDLGSRLVEETDPQGRVTRLTWDPLGRMTGKALADGRAFAWRYDEGGAAAGMIGRLTSVSDPTGTERFSYDALGRVTGATRTLFGSTFTTTTAWDAMGRITDRTLPGAVTFGFRYDAGGRLAAVSPWISSVGTDVRGSVNDLVYLGGNRLTRETDPATGRLLSIHGTAGTGETLLDLAYGYDPDGLITAIDNRTVANAVVSEQYSYDGRHRLRQASGPFGTLQYDYDDGGTIRSKEGVTLSAGNPAQPQQIVWTSAGDAFDYDAAGNLTERARTGADRHLTYDAAGRLVRLEEPARSLVVTSDYDASGQLVRETTDQAGQRTTVLFPFPGVEVRDGRITTNLFLGTLRALVIGPDGTVYHPMSDALGSARVVASASGQVIARAAYRPYGDGQGAELSDPISSLRYAGVHRQSASGLLVMGWRHFDPVTGRFLEPDPLVAAPLDPQALNRYAYARDNPVNLVDPDGHNPFLLLGILGVYAILDRDTRADAATSVALTAASIVLTGMLGPGGAAGVAALRASTPALYAAAATSILMHTPLGQGIVDGYAGVLEDLGLSARASYAIAGAGTTFLLNSHLQHSYAAAIARNGPLERGASLGDRAHLDQALADRGLDPATFGTRAGDAYGTTVLDRRDAAGGPELERFYELRDEAGGVPGVFGVRDLGGGFDHGAAAIAQSGATTAIETHRHFLYLVGGISTQQVGRDLFESGYSASLFTLTGRASDFMIEYFYGPYGGGLFFGLHEAFSGQNSGEDP
ncbi:MAG TPA: toxin TcdB middle/N-terminal domain-containing protein, partial [Candidatus Polarisedimenticolia bacterium]|nr:toxin TcdB middle/N-terminal domain-containing protein [Candidatus Polarisedimenticolia bacterium]